MSPSLCLSLLAALGVAAEAPEESERTDPLCGAYCLYISLRSLDCDVASYADVERRLGPPPRGGYSMAQLAEVARTYGAQTLGVLTSLENLVQRDPPVACIALLDRSHYVNIADIRDGQVRIIDPPREYVVDRNTLAALWPGEALLVARKPLLAEEAITRRGSWSVVFWAALAVLVGIVIAWLCRSAGRKARSVHAGLIAILFCGCADQQTSSLATPPPRSDLVWATRHVDLGNVQVSTQPTDAVFNVRNLGTAPVRLERVELSCRCASADWSDELIETGEQANMTLQIRTNQAGKHTATATVICDDPDTNPVRLTVAWNAVAPVEVRPAQIDFGDVLPGSIHPARFRSSNTRRPPALS